MAMNCWVVPSTMLGFAGAMVTEVMTAGVTLSVAEGFDVMLENVAAMVVVPSLTAMANPREPAALLIVATPVSNEVQIAHVVKFC